ncbi:ribbon-helix-helix domain-containing protein [Mesorhizobium sp. VNQ89]|uniref:ribbon-helix-helix domain-containing protein n=1 Tax=Mesorhizobium quangtriensis TaxID=3157709 RepID=UPI0032B7335D
MSVVRKHSVSIRGHRTSFSIEQPFLDELRKIAETRGMPLAALIAAIDEERPRDANLSSALRVFVLREAQRTAIVSSGSDSAPPTD